MLIQAAGVPHARSITININGSISPAAPVKEVKGKGIAEVLKEGAALTTVYKGGTYLIGVANTTTPHDLASIFQSHHLIADPKLALDQADSLLAHIQSKGGNALLAGALAGALAITAVDIIKPDAPKWVKFAIGLLCLALVSGLLYWGLDDKPIDKNSPAKSGQSPTP